MKKELYILNGTFVKKRKFEFNNNDSDKHKRFILNEPTDYSNNWKYKWNKSNEISN